MDYLFSFSYDIRALRLEYKTTCDAIKRWPGGDPKEQDFLEKKKKEVFRQLSEYNFRKN